MKKNLFDIGKREKNRIRNLHEAYVNSHGTIILKEESADEITTFQETWNSRNPDDQITVDGKSGPETKDRVKKFQQATKIQADGVVGPQTLEKMDTLDDSMWDKIMKKIKKWKDKITGGDEELSVDGDVKSDEEIDPDEEGMCPNAKNDKAYRMIKKAVSGWGTNEDLLWKALSTITSWDEYKDMSTVVRCEFPDEFKSVSQMIMSDLSGKYLDKFKGIRRAIHQDGSWSEGGMSTWDMVKKKQAEQLGNWVTKMMEAAKEEAKIKAAALKKVREWGWKTAQWSPFWMLARKKGKKLSWFEELFT